jgi:hypothetical protein
MDLKQKLRAILLGVVMLGGALSGVAIRPEDIAGLLDVHNKIQVMQVIRKVEEDGDEE